MERKIIEYFIVDAQDKTDAEEMVNDYINKGFQPWGSLAFFVDSDIDLYYRQAMVKYE